MDMDRKNKIQSDLYVFPYHYLVDLENKKFNKNLFWGLDYYNYINKVIDLATKYIKNDILDLGCGDGFLLYNLKKSYLDKNVNAVGIDIDEKPIKFAQAFSAGIPNLTFINQDIQTYNKKFDLITVIETLEHIPDNQISDFIIQIDKHLANEGILIISVPSKNVALGKKHYRHYDVDMLKESFKNYNILETHFVTKKNNFLYKLTEFLLCNNKVNLNFSIFKKILFLLNKKLFYLVKENEGAHIILVLKNSSAISSHE